MSATLHMYRVRESMSKGPTVDCSCPILELHLKVSRGQVHSIFLLGFEERGLSSIDRRKSLRGLLISLMDKDNAVIEGNVYIATKY